jgi:hypothetical protein
MPWMTIRRSGAVTAMAWFRHGEGVSTILQQVLNVAAIRRK